jgi:hypothetical protein
MDSTQASSSSSSADMTGQRSSSSGGVAAAGCDLWESRKSPLSMTDGGDIGCGMVCSIAGLAVFSWGRGEDGQLGIGDTSDLQEPTFVDALRGVGVRQIACGSGHTVVLTTDGSVSTSMYSYIQ